MTFSDDMSEVSPVDRAIQNQLDVWIIGMFKEGHLELRDSMIVGLEVAWKRDLTREEKQHLRLRWFELLNQETQPEEEGEIHVEVEVEVEAGDEGDVRDSDLSRTGADSDQGERDGVGGSEGGQGDGGLDREPTEGG